MTHEAAVEHSDGGVARIPLMPNRPVGEVTRDVLAAARKLGGAFEINPTPQEVPWSVPLDEDDEHATYDPDQVASYFATATHAALVLAAFRAPVPRPLDAGERVVGHVRPGREPLFGPRPSRRPMTSSCATRWMRRRSPSAGGPATRGTARPRSSHTPTRAGGFAGATLSPAIARWDETLGEYLLDWDDVRSSPDPHAAALEFARSVFRHACAVCDWDPALPASAEGAPPPVT